MNDMTTKANKILVMADFDELEIETTPVVNTMFVDLDKTGIELAESPYDEFDVMVHNLGNINSKLMGNIPSPRSVTSMDSLKLPNNKKWSPYTHFAFEVLKEETVSEPSKKMAFITVQFGEEFSRELLKSSNPSVLCAKKLEYTIRNALGEKVKALIVLEESHNRPISEIEVNDDGDIKMLGFALHAHILLVGDESKIKSLCSNKSKHSLWRFSTQHDNSICCKFTYKSLWSSTSNFRGFYRNNYDFPLTSGVSDYMAKNLHKPIKKGARNFSFMGISSEVADKWDQVYRFQQKLINSFQYSMLEYKKGSNPGSIMSDLLEVLERER